MISFRLVIYMKVIVEHMEQGFSSWVKLEYRAISKELGASNFYLCSVPDEATIPDELKDACTSTNYDVAHLHIVDPNFSLERCCLLDPTATEALEPQDSLDFDYFLFGGILGDDPPRDRTGELRKLGFVGRNLGPVQMTTDTAVRTAVRVLQHNQKLENIPYIDNPELRFNEHESTIMPFRYIRDESGAPIMPEGMVNLIQEDSDQTLEGLL